MTRHFKPPAATPAIPAMLVEAVRCWREARDTGRPVQPCIARVLDEYDCAVLAPVFDSLCLFFEGALGRPLTVGGALDRSDDELLLVGLVEGAPGRCPNSSAGPGTGFDCALCSTRIMLALTFGHLPVH